MHDESGNEDERECGGMEMRKCEEYGACRKFVASGTPYLWNKKRVQKCGMSNTGKQSWGKRRQAVLIMRRLSLRHGIEKRAYLFIVRIVRIVCSVCGCRFQSSCPLQRFPKQKFQVAVNTSEFVSSPFFQRRIYIIVYPQGKVLFRNHFNIYYLC